MSTEVSMIIICKLHQRCNNVHMYNLMTEAMMCILHLVFNRCAQLLNEMANHDLPIILALCMMCLKVCNINILSPTLWIYDL